MTVLPVPLSSVKGRGRLDIGREPVKKQDCSAAADQIAKGIVGFRV